MSDSAFTDDDTANAEDRMRQAAATLAAKDREPLSALGALEREVRWQLAKGAPGLDPMASLNRRDLDAKFAVLRSALKAEAPEPGALDVDVLAAAWANVMDGRRIARGLGEARIGRDTTTTDDWHVIAAEYAATVRSTTPPEPEDDPNE